MWTDYVTAISSNVLALVAIVAAVAVIRNISILREQQRRNTLLALLNDMANTHSRENRKVIYINFKPDTFSNDGELGEYVGVQAALSTDVREAIEETISIMDRVGFFTLNGDKKLTEEAPVWIWTVTNEMWERLGPYVQLRQKEHAGYGQYFEQLHIKAQNRS